MSRTVEPQTSRSACPVNMHGTAGVSQVLFALLHGVCTVFFSTSADAVWAECPGLFFPRVRTPCGHGAQVIVEGREEKTDGGERNEDPKKQPKNQTPKPAGRLHHLVVFPIHLVKRVRLRLVTTSGPEFAKEVDCSASCVLGKPPRRLQTDFPYQVLVTSGHTTVWQNKVTLQVRCLAMLQQWLQSGQPKVRRSKQQSMGKTILAAQPVQPMAHTRPVTCCQTEFNYGGNS